MAPPATITYSLHPTPTTPSPASHILRSAIEGIRAHLPLRNLHWKSSSRTSLRTIQEVDINLIDLGEASSIRDNNGSVLDAPLVNLCLVVCEDADVYKNQTRNFIRDWLSLLAARRTPHAPVIVLVNPPNVAEKTGKNVWGKDKGVLGKLKADFNISKRDRCVQLNLPPPGTSDPAAWPELINKLKESFVSAFDSAILEREDEVKRGEAQRVVVGWNFCTWFLLKESLAQSFESVNLNEDSLIIYEELEAAFIQIVKEQNLSWFGRLGATGPKDDSLPILDTQVKPYRDLLRSSSISIFDFRVYLFARQGILLGKLGRITEVAKRGQWFVASLAKRLRENEADLANHFIESWTYTACMDVVEKCDHWSCIDRPNGDYSGLTAYESARSELLDIARIQVERLGVSIGHLPNEYPFQQPAPPQQSRSGDVLFEDPSEISQPPSPVKSNRPELSNPILLPAIASQADFIPLYRDLTIQAIEAYEKCNKRASAIRPKTDLVAVSLLNQEFEETYDLSRALAKECVDLRVWDPVLRYALRSALKSHDHLGKARDRSWGDLAVAYMRVCSGEKEGTEELREVVDGLQKSQASWDVEGHKAFSLRVKGDETTLDGDETTLDADVTNSLDMSIEITEISVDLVNAAGESISFSVESYVLEPGVNHIRLTSSTSTQGIYILQSATITLGQVNFVYNKAVEGSTFKVRRDETGVSARLRMPHDIRLDSDSMVVLEITSGKSDLQEALLSLRSLNGEIRYMLGAATREGRRLDLNDQGEIVVGAVAIEKVVEIIIPYSGVPQGDSAQAYIALEYEANGKLREWVDTQKVNMSLPLTVNVQDFFRPQLQVPILVHLLSHFTISSEETDSLRVQSVELKASEESEYAVEACRKEWNETIVVNPRQPLSCLFKIRRKESGDPSIVLRMVIKYRNIEQEIRHSVAAAIRTLPPVSRAPVGRKIRPLLSVSSNWKAYLVGEPLGQLLRPAFEDDIPNAESFCRALDAVEQPVWRSLEIPVDVPQRRLLTSIRITPRSTSGRGLIYQGQPLAMVISLSTSPLWMGLSTPLSDEEKNQKLVFDVQVNADDWLVLGKKKGCYTADPGKDEEQEIILLPLRSGTLFLPTVSVQPLDTLTPIDASDKSQARSQVLCESFVENAAEVVRVLSAQKEVTALVPAALPAGIPTRDWEDDRL
ncbi:hypothetical protein B9479_002503 [Cryptococcus floricola]|uniref:Trafficking protein particle complex subunit 11 domain-containing protein n=1 Tax=Cryptococcus floricola TaxID=2591691 RepID=A0A5D3B3L3_9TREE|nr:hypothetical protein B9479_002503 [Cryptococcus floricola]